MSVDAIGIGRLQTMEDKMERNVSSKPDFLETAGTNTIHDVLRLEEEARHLQAEVNAQVMTALVHGLGRAVRWTATGIARFLRDQWVGVAAYRVNNELRRLSDRQLAELGIRRDEITSYVASLVTTEPAEQPVALKALAGGLTAAETRPQEGPVRRRAA